MGARDVDRIIEQWRAEAQAAGDGPPSFDDGRPPGRVRALVRRVGLLRLAAAAVAVSVFALVALPVLRAPSDPVPGNGAAVGEASDPSQAGGAGVGVSDGSAPGAGSEDLARTGDAAAAAAEGPAAAGAPDTGTAAPGGAAPADPAGPGTADRWYSIMQSVDEARAAAYGAADPARLDSVFAADGPALQRERAAVEALAGGGLRAVGWGTELLSVRVVEQSADTARLSVRDRRGPYEVRDTAGRTTSVPPAAAAEWLVSLRRDGQRWQVLEVAAGADP